MKNKILTNMIIRLSARAIRSKIYILVEQEWEHKNMYSYEHGCISKTIYIYHTYNDIAFNIMNIKTENMLIINNKSM